MAKFKSGAQGSVRVVHYNPAAQFARRLVVTMLTLGMVVASGLAGWYVGQNRQIALSSERTALSEELVESQREVEALQRQVVVLQRGNAVERQASEQVRQEVTALNEKIYQLEKEITFYKNLMSPAAGAKQLQVHDIALETTSRDRQFRFKLVLTQVTERHDRIKGGVKMVVSGTSQGTRHELSLGQLGAGAEEISFSFRYFQELEGELTLPKGFAPESIRVTARSSGRKPLKVEREFTWSAQEAESHVGQG